VRDTRKKIKRSFHICHMRNQSILDIVTIRNQVLFFSRHGVYYVAWRSNMNVGLTNQTRLHTFIVRRRIKVSIFTSVAESLTVRMSCQGSYKWP